MNEDFKLIAIRPLNGCDKRFSKVLSNGEFYKFYNNYDFFVTKDDNNEEISVEENISKSESLYKINREEYPLSINISALVGQNGAGKSTIIELLFLTVYLLSLEKDKIKIHSSDKRQTRELANIKSGLKVEIYYSIGSSVYCLRFCNDESIDFIILKATGLAESRRIKLSQILDEKLDFSLDDFFYSIGINYSIHGLNSQIIGSWIKSLFHKNDGYQTPIVINPMRDKGNFDINEENYFAKTRLFSNLLVPHQDKSHLNLTDNQKATHFEFSLKKSKTQYALKKYISESESLDITFDTIFANNNKNELLLDIFNVFFEMSLKENEVDYQFNSVRFHEEAIKYIIKKLIKIARTYDVYKDHFADNLKVISENGTVDYEYKFSNFKEYLEDLKIDNSHITFKLKQAVNYLKNDILRNDLKKDLNWSIIKDRPEEIFRISVADLSKRITGITRNPASIVYHIPPSLFNIDIVLEKIGANEEDNKQSKFNDISSGEQQLIHSVQSVLYHLINLNSVFKQKPGQKDEKKKRNTYHYINIIFDEVELYFHPDYQRKFISLLLKSIGKLNIEKILSINILFSTHSPFILSDIPSENILRLKDGTQEPFFINEQTFGANINDILANDFFLREGFMGQFVKDKINSLISFIENGDVKNDEWDISIAKNFIELIGEPLIRMELRELFHRKFYDATDIEIEEIDAEIQRLQEIKNIKSKINDSN